MARTKQRQKTNTNKVKAILLGIAVVIALLLHYFPNLRASLSNYFPFIEPPRQAMPVTGDLDVHFIDVGKADGIYIRCNGKHILIDSGDVEYSGKVANYLKRQGVKTLDLAVATHFDRDHIGGMANVIMEFEVKRFLRPDLPQELLPSSSVYEAMNFALDYKNVPVESPQIGESFSLGGLEIQTLGPQRVYDDMNDNSILLKMTYGQASFLFMGDAEENAEEDLLAQDYDLKSTVLKVGHHGSKTSTSQELLDAVKPEAAVISVGEDGNELPKTQVLDRLSENGVTVFRTDLNGTIIMASNGDQLHIFMEKDEEN